MVMAQLDKDSPNSELLERSMHELRLLADIFRKRGREAEAEEIESFLCQIRGASFTETDESVG
jgi:hypothetical protein